MDNQTPIARDEEEFYFHSEGQEWIVSWHSPVLPAPIGQAHGSAALCITPENNIVLVSTDGQNWSFPGGRPEENEDWRMTMEREVLEEACVTVKEAELLGFSRGVCINGPEEGLILIRSLWRADVSLLDWEPHHEISYRQLVPSDTAQEWLFAQASVPIGLQPIYRRWFYEALHTA